MNRILFVNIGWMIHYKGNTNNDTIKGGGCYRDVYKHEAYNFLNIKGLCYGYVQTVRGGKINLGKIDSSIGKDSEEIDDVLVIWTARNPESGGTYIVGWYKHAIVYRALQKINALERNNYRYNVKAKFQNCYLLPVDDRVFEVPRARNNLNKGFMGQSNVWYANQNFNDILLFRKKVIEYINSVFCFGKANRNSLKINTKVKKIVEQTAVNAVISKYQKKGYKVVSVEKDNLGWDLEAIKDKIRLRIEVKGLSDKSISVHLTANEYSQMVSNDNLGYRLCIVTNVLKSPIITTFLFDRKRWVCEDDSEIYLSFNESIVAVAFVE